MVVSSIVDANLPGFAKSRRAGEGQNQMRVGVDADCIIRGETGRGGGLRLSAPGRHQGKGGKRAE
jgi:hypothetical protein